MASPLTPNPTLYDPQTEHDGCGVGVVANIKGRKSHEIVVQGLEVLQNLAHRGAMGSDPETGDGAGIHGRVGVDRESVAIFNDSLKRCSIGFF